jgi:hypothetical protein
VTVLSPVNVHSPEDLVVQEAQQFVAAYGTKKHGRQLQALMDIVSGIQGYRMDSKCPQGIIHQFLFAERIENNHVIDYDVVISHFWQGVFEYLPNAMLRGTKVMVRKAALPTTDGSVTVELSISKHGRDYEERETKMPPVNYLRMQGRAAMRKFVNSCYKTRLRQQCNSCGRTGSLGVQKEEDKGCPKCKSINSKMLAGVMRRRSRACLDCGHVRFTTMKRVCGHPREKEDGTIEYVDGCGGVDVQTLQTEEYLTDHEKWDGVLGEDGHDPEVHIIHNELEKDASEFVQACIGSMPRDARDPNGDSQTRKILRILVDPQDGAKICKDCRDDSDSVCAQSCADPLCDHDRMPDPKQSCGAKTFSLSECINYSKKIGDHLGYTASLANRRVAKVRKHAAEFARQNGRRFVTARYIARRLSTEEV